MNPDRDVTADFLGEFSDVLGSQHSPAADAAYETSSTFQGTFHMVVQLLLYVGVFVLLALTSAWVFGLARSREVFVRRMHGSSWWQIMRVPLWFELGFTVALIAAVWLIASRDEMMVPMIRWDEGRDGTVVALLIGAAAAASVFWAGQSVFRTQRSNHT